MEPSFPPTNGIPVLIPADGPASCAKDLTCTAVHDIRKPWMVKQAGRSGERPKLANFTLSMMGLQNVRTLESQRWMDVFVVKFDDLS